MGAHVEAVISHMHVAKDLIVFVWIRSHASPQQHGVNGVNVTVRLTTVTEVHLSVRSFFSPT